MAAMAPSDLMKIVGKDNNITSIPSLLVATNAYFSKEDSVVSVAEERHLVGENVISLANSEYGSSSQVVIPCQQVVQDMYLRLVIPALGAGATAYVAGDLALPTGWGYNCIDDLTVTLGGSNENLYYSGDMLLAMAQSQCRGRDAFDDVLQRAGRGISCLAAADAHVYGNWRDYEQEALVPLNFIWMSLNNHSKCGKGLPTDLLSQPISLVVRFKKLKEIMAGNDNVGFTKLLGSASLAKSRFQTAEIIMRASEFTDSGFSLKGDLMLDSSKFYSIPYYQVRRGTSHRMDKKVLSATQTFTFPETFNLNGVEDADLVSIMFMARRYDRVAPSTADGSVEALNPFDLLDFRDVRLRFNGKTIFYAPGDSHNTISWMSSNKSGGSGFSTQVIPRAVQKVTGSTYYISRLLEIHLSRSSWAQCGEHLENTVRYINSSLQLEFSLVDVNGSPSSNNSYEVLSFYVYPASVKLQAGTSRISLL